MTNIKQAIDGRNKTILNNDKATESNKQCNCRKPQDCPVNGQCFNKSVIYQATVKTTNGEEDQTYMQTIRRRLRTRKRIPVQSSARTFGNLKRRTLNSGKI